MAQAQPDGEPSTLRMHEAVAVVATPTSIALVLMALTPVASRLLTAHPSSLDLTLTPILTNVVSVATMAAVLRREGRSLTPTTVGLWPIRWNRFTGWGRWLTPVAIAALVALTASPLRQESIELIWRHVPGPWWSVNSTPQILDGQFPLTVTTGVLAFQFLVRQPFTVLVEETFFQGFLFERVGAGAPLKVALLGSLYHAFMWWSVPALIPYNLAISLLRWYTGNPWPGIGIHLGTNASYFLGLLSAEG